MESLIVLAAVSVICNLVLWRNSVYQQRTIDRLTDKLMSRDYKEYVSMQPRPTEAQHPTREPLSWHDDPTIDDDGVAN